MIINRIASNVVDFEDAEKGRSLSAPQTDEATQPVPLLHQFEPFCEPRVKDATDRQSLNTYLEVQHEHEHEHDFTKKLEF